MPDPASREFDVVLWGATGFTGRVVAESFAEGAPAGLRWALAGRDRARLEALRTGLAADAGIVVADASDAAGLAAVARRTSVVLSTVGPYARLGTPLVAACVEAGSDYADITGETLWMRASIDAFHARAQQTGARVVHACGFDSVPSDLGLWLLQSAAMQRRGRPCTHVEHVFGPMSGGIGGGTIASAFGVLASVADDPGTRRALADHDLLAPGAPPGPVASDPWWPRWQGSLSTWTAPFPMAGVNTRVVRRSRALLGEPWGAETTYGERLRAPHWPGALAIGAASVLAPVALAWAPLRRWLERRLPAPGEGPDATTLSTGSFRSTLVGHVADDESPVIVEIVSPFDPGYGATARMLRETGLALALGELSAAGGVHTPASVGAARLLERIDAAGVRFTVL
jgi:short subunit dehydrogenase-like uncharacterized protein